MMPFMFLKIFKENHNAEITIDIRIDVSQVLLPVKDCCKQFFDNTYISPLVKSNIGHRRYSLQLWFHNKARQNMSYLSLSQHWSSLFALNDARRQCLKDGAPVTQNTQHTTALFCLGIIFCQYGKNTVWKKDIYISQFMWQKADSIKQ